MDKYAYRKGSHSIYSLNSPLKKLVFPDRFAKGAIVPLRVSCAISR